MEAADACVLAIGSDACVAPTWFDLWLWLAECVALCAPLSR